MTSAAEVLAHYGVTVEQARTWLLAHLGDLPAVLAIADQFGLSNDMLAEIVGPGFTGAQVHDYFTAHGLDSATLDDGIAGNGTGGARLAGPVLPDYFAELAGLVSLDSYAGALSATSLRDRVIAATNSSDYWDMFDPGNFAGAADGTFSTDDLGFTTLGALPATAATVESLYFGTLAHLVKAIDLTELGDIQALATFAKAHSAELGAGDPAVIGQYVDMLYGIFSDPAHFQLVPDNKIADLIVQVTTDLVKVVGAGDALGVFGSLLDIHLG